MKTLNYKYKLVTNWEELKQLVVYCKQTKYASTDYESTGTSAMYPGSKPTILGVSFQPGSAWIIPLAHKESPFLKNEKWKLVLRYFGREVIENPDIIKVGQNIKFEINWWYKYGIIMVGRIFDTMLAKYLLDEERPHGLKEMVTRFIPKFSGYDLPGQPSAKAGIDKLIEFWSNVPLKDLSLYCAFDADLCLRLWIFFERRLIDSGFYTLFRNMMMMASRVLAEVEWRGNNIDRDYLRELIKIYEIKIIDCEKRLRNNPIIIQYEKSRMESVKRKMISDLKKEIRTIRNQGYDDERVIKRREEKISRYIAGDYINKKEQKMVAPTNFGSPKQMIDLLFDSPDGFKFDVVKFTENKETRKKTETASTDEAVLIELKELDDSGFINDLLELRGLTKLNSTYIVGMWERLTSDNRVHASFLLHGTVTGRLSSRNPNLQNIPRDTTSSDIKRMFVAPKGKLILQLDYSQAELRVLAYQAKENTMIEWFSEGKDIHLAVACKKFGGDYDEVKEILADENHKEFIKWKKRRKKAKTTNFGIVYEQSARKLAQTLSDEGIPTSLYEAEEFLKEWFADFPRVKRYIKVQHKFAEEHGYVYSLFGRKRRLLNVSSSNWGQKSEALRQAVNAPIQGTASDFALFSSILIREHIIRQSLPLSLEQVGTVHDSLKFYIDPIDIHEAVPKLYSICRNPETKTWFNFEVKGIEMKVDFEIGKNWGELFKYDPQENYLTWVT